MKGKDLIKAIHEAKAEELEIMLVDQDSSWRQWCFKASDVEVIKVKKDNQEYVRHSEGLEVCIIS